MDYALRLTQRATGTRNFRAALGAALREALPEGKLSALYFGTEFCEHRIPTLSQALRRIALARERGLEAVLLTPVVRDEGLGRLRLLLDDLAARDALPTLTFNDWGVARMARREHPSLCLLGGRLLNRALRDPRLAAAPDASTRAASPDGERSARLRSFLASLSVTGLETDADLEGGFLGPATPGFLRVLHLPYVYATTGRHCVMKMAAAAGEGSLSRDLGRPCRAPCRGKPWAERRPDASLPLRRAGNTLFYEAPRDLLLAHVRGADRLVIHPEPMP